MPIHDSTTLTKVCTHCGIEKPATTEYFARQKAGKYGFRADCKACHYTRQHKWHQTERGREVARSNGVKRQKKWREFWLEFPNVRERPYATITCSRCKCDLPSTSEYFHHDDTTRYGFTKVCKSCMIEYQSEYNQRPETKRRVKEYANRPDVQARQRAILNNRRSAHGSFTAQDIEDIRKAQGNRCYICHKKLKKYHIDHFIPLVLGGTNDPGNLRLACPHCNLSKNKKHPHDMGLLI